MDNKGRQIIGALVHYRFSDGGDDDDDFLRAISCCVDLTDYNIAYQLRQSL